MAPGVSNIPDSYGRPRQHRHVDRLGDHDYLPPAWDQQHASYYIRQLGRQQLVSARLRNTNTCLLTAKLQRIKRVEFEPRERNIHVILGSRMWIPQAYSNTCQTGTGSTNTCHVQPLQDVQTTTPEPGDFEEGLLPYALELVGAQPPWTYLSKGDVQGLRECGFTRGNYPVLNIDSTCAYVSGDNLILMSLTDLHSTYSRG